MANSSDAIKQFQQLQRRQEEIKAELIKAQTIREQKKLELDKLTKEIKELGVDVENAPDFIKTTEREIENEIKKLSAELDKIDSNPESNDSLAGEDNFDFDIDI